jgi:hypothetical protein
MSDFKKKYLKYKNKYLKTKIMMYGGSRIFRNVDDIQIVRYGNGDFICDVEFIDMSNGTEPRVKINFSRTNPEGSYTVLDRTYFFTNLELLKMKDEARKRAYPKIEGLFDHNELKKFYERKPEIDEELANESRNEEKEKQQKIRRDQYERERIIKLEEEERIRKLEEKEAKEKEAKEKEAEENRRKKHEIYKSLEKHILNNDFDLAIEEYLKIEQSLNEDDKEFMKKVFLFNYIMESENRDIKKIKVLLEKNIIKGQRIIEYYLHKVIPLDILELILSKSNDNLEFPGRFFAYQFDLIKKDRKYSDQQKDELSNNLKILLDSYNIDYN